MSAQRPSALLHFPDGLHIFLDELLHLLRLQRLQLAELGDALLHDVLVLVLGDLPSSANN
jgi:hypothetical protein